MDWSLPEGSQLFPPETPSFRTTAVPTASSSSASSHTLGTSPDLLRQSSHLLNTPEDPFGGTTLLNNLNRATIDPAAASLWTPTQPSGWSSAIAEASHQSLIHNRNLQYIKVFEACGTLKSQQQETQRAYEDLKLRYDTLSTAYNTLVTAVSDRLSASSASTSAGISNPLAPTSSNTDHLRVLSAGDYPAVKFWSKDDFTEAEKARKDVKGKAKMSDPVTQRGSGRLVKDDANVMFWYIQDKDGKTVSGKRIKAIRAHARQIWSHLLSIGKAPDTWSNATSVVRSYYAGEMRRQFPELQLCDLDYKSHSIATEIYPGWRMTYITNKAPIKVESDIDEDLDNLDNLDDDATETKNNDHGLVGNKRSATAPPVPEPAPKKSKSTAKPRALKPKPVTTRGPKSVRSSKRPASSASTAGPSSESAVSCESPAATLPTGDPPLPSSASSTSSLASAPTASSLAPSDISSTSSSASAASASPPVVPAISSTSASSSSVSSSAIPAISSTSASALSVSSTAPSAISATSSSTSAPTVFSPVVPDISSTSSASSASSSAPPAISSLSDRISESLLIPTPPSMTPAVATAPSTGHTALDLLARTALHTDVLIETQ
ncbi:hypothetical protein C8R45DRAFT_93866 [Mycena sanguinolenta]|nr:hypothetical protein C8R45DRAFT_93866 [Mycena sanguinolenta]